MFRLYAAGAARAWLSCVTRMLKYAKNGLSFGSTSGFFVQSAVEVVQPAGGLKLKSVLPGQKVA